MDEMQMSDKQRDSALKLSDKRKKLHGLLDRLHQADNVPVDSHSDSFFDTNAFEDEPAKRKAQPPVRDPQKVLAQIDELKREIEDLETSLLTYLGRDPAELARRRRAELESHFAVEEEDSVTDLTVASAAEYPEIPSLGSSENLDTVRHKLVVLNDLRVKSEFVVSNHQTEKRLNEIANEDDEVDPLDAFMASTSVELADQQIDKEQVKLAAIVAAIYRFQKLESVLSKNQFSGTNIAQAIKQQQHIATRVHDTSATSSSVEAMTARGLGTVWESEFQKDESVPKRLKADSSTRASPAAAVPLNLQRGGLQVLHAPASKPAVSRAPSETAQKRQEDLRKKLGY